MSNQKEKTTQLRSFIDSFEQLFFQIIDLSWQHHIQIAKSFFIFKASDHIQENEHFSIPMFNHLPGIYHHIQNKKAKNITYQAQTNDLKQKQRRLLAKLRARRTQKKKGKRKKKKNKNSKSATKIKIEIEECQKMHLEIQQNQSLITPPKEQSFLLNYNKIDFGENLMCVMCQEPIDCRNEAVLYGSIVTFKNFRRFLVSKIKLNEGTLLRNASNQV